MSRSFVPGKKGSRKRATTTDNTDEEVTWYLQCRVTY